MNEALITWYESHNSVLENWDIKPKDSDAKAYRYRSSNDGTENGLTILERALTVIPKGSYILDGWRNSNQKEKFTYAFTIASNPMNIQQQSQSGYYGGRNTEHMIPWHIHESQIQAARQEERLRAESEIRFMKLELKYEQLANPEKKSKISEIRELLKEFSPLVPDASEFLKSAGSMMNKPTDTVASEGVKKVAAELPKADNSAGFDFDTLKSE